MKLVLPLVVCSVLGLLVLPTQAALQAYYSFDRDFLDGSGSNNHLINPSGTPNITSTGGEVKFGSGALNLDQSGTEEFLEFTSDFDFDGSSPWSMSWWGQRSSSALGSQGMITGTRVNSNNFVWTPDNPSVVQGIRLRDSSGTSLDYGGIVDDNAYHHWAVSYDGAGQVSVWRDNTLLIGMSQAFSGDVLMQFVGAGTNSKNNSFYGQIDELYIFDEAIDSTVVGNLFSTNTIPEPGTTALFGLGGLLLLARRRRA